MNRNRTRLLFAGASGVVFAAYASEALTPLLVRPAPHFVYHEPLCDSNWVIVCMHGNASDGSQFDQLVEFLRTLGGVLVVYNSVNPLASPAAIVAELRRLDLLNRNICTYGISMGGRTGFRFMACFYRATGRPVMRAILESVPTGARGVIWDHGYEPYATRVLKGGPITRAVWRLGHLDGHPLTQTASGTLVTTRKPKAGAHVPWRLLVMETEDDPRVQSGADYWRRIAPDVTVCVLPGRGHAEMDLHHNHRVAAIMGWLW